MAADHCKPADALAMIRRFHMVEVDTGGDAFPGATPEVPCQLTTACRIVVGERLHENAALRVDADDRESREMNEFERQRVE